MTWDADRRVIQWWVIEPKFVGTAVRARWMIEKWSSWVGTSEPFTLLADCAGIVATDAPWRSMLHGYMRDNRDRLTVAWFNASPVIRVALEMFLVGTPGLFGAIFATKSAACTWVKKRAKHPCPHASP